MKQKVNLKGINSGMSKGNEGFPAFFPAAFPRLLAYWVENSHDASNPVVPRTTKARHTHKGINLVLGEKAENLYDSHPEW